MVGLIGGDAVSVSVSAAQANGIQFLSRYLSDYPSKNLTLAEAKMWTAAGIWLVSNWEDGTTDWEGGRTAGSRNAAVAAAQHEACGGPTDRPIYFSIDMDADPASVVNSGYFQGINASIGVGRTGVYASTGVCLALHQAGLANWFWRTMSTGWNGGAGIPSDFNVIQTGAFSGALDRDVSETTDFGQWMVGIDPQGVDMLSQSDINAIALAVWAYQNKASGDTVDVHQMLKNAAANTPAAVWSFKNAALDKFDMRQYLVNAANNVVPPSTETGGPIA